MTTYAQHPDNKTLGDVGHGTLFGADLFYLFKAGKLLVPDAAIRFADGANHIHNTTGALEGLATTTGERALHKLVAIREDVHRALRRTAVNMNETGVALVDTAIVYARTDSAALARFRRMRQKFEDNSDSDYPPQFVEPPRPGETPPTEFPMGVALPGLS